MRNKTIVITGGAGFIGSALVRSLLQLGANKIIILDSLEYGDTHNIPSPTTETEIIFHNITIQSGVYNQLLPILSGVDYVFHLAAEKHNQSILIPHKVLDVNIHGTFELYQACADAGVKKIVFSSSLYAYGRMAGGNFTEQELPTPQTIYGISKLTGENFAHYFFIKYGLPIINLRYLFIYGPRQYNNMGYKSVIVKTMERILRGEKPIINGNGQQILDYVFVDDCVALTINAMQLQTENSPINICSGQGIRVLDLIEKISAIAGYTGGFEYAPPDVTHNTYRVGCPKKCQLFLGVDRPLTTLENGLTTTFEWIKNNGKY